MIKNLLPFTCLSLISFITMIAQPAFAGYLDDLKIFPKPDKNQIRWVIKLPKKQQESLNKVEIIPGKVSETDACNYYNLSGQLQNKELTNESSGLSYYVFNTDGTIITTLMACLDDKITRKFVSGETKIVSYNSQLPIVIYTPKDIKIQYRILQGDKKTQYAIEK